MKKTLLLSLLFFSTLSLSGCNSGNKMKVLLNSTPSVLYAANKGAISGTMVDLRMTFNEMSHLDLSQHNAFYIIDTNGTAHYPDNAVAYDSDYSNNPVEMLSFVSLSDYYYGVGTHSYGFFFPGTISEDGATYYFGDTQLTPGKTYSISFDAYLI